MRNKRVFMAFVVVLGLLGFVIVYGAPQTMAARVSLSSELLRPFAIAVDDSSPPSEPVKLIFIHHSTGGNWLADSNNDQPSGGLGRALMDNNYFVSATNYGWGPDSIGDRTDIVNWPEWFIGPNRDTYLDALYNETAQNVGDFGNWSRRASDPGGENTIIMFKSCFPNSDLYGNSNDAAYPTYNEDEYSVANAKAIYNALLGYFETRQDKLFVVITAPPLMSSETESERAFNARAFNNWLVNEWLQDYAYANVAVFDYYNVLTDPDNHHRWNGSAIEHLQPADTNFSAYPSGDSHPSIPGHSKATAEFVPLLNVYYQRWQASDVKPPPPTEVPSSQEPAATATVATDATAEPLPISTLADGMLDNFESDMEWYADIGEGAVVECVRDANAYRGEAALRIAYTIPENSWGGCGRYFDVAHDWGVSTGLSLWLRADEPERWVTLAVFAGDLENPTPFEIGLEATSEWTQLNIPWSDIARAAWADDNGIQELDTVRITGLGLSWGEGEGHLWVDDVALLTGEVAPPTVEKPAEPELITESDPIEGTSEETADEASSDSGSGMCASAPLALSLVVLNIVLGRHRTKNISTG